MVTIFIIGGVFAAVNLGAAITRNDAQYDPSVAAPSNAERCEFWVAPQPEGNDSNNGSVSRPWATMQHASDNIPDNDCIIWFQPGEYMG